MGTVSIMVQGHTCGDERPTSRSSGTLRRDGCETAATLMTLSNARSKVYRPDKGIGHLSASPALEKLTTEAEARSSELRHALFFEASDDFVKGGTGGVFAMVDKPVLQAKCTGLSRRQM